MGLLWLLVVQPAGAQDEPAEADAGADESQASADESQAERQQAQIEELQRELEAQRAELERQRARLEEQERARARRAGRKEGEVSAEPTEDDRSEEDAELDAIMADARSEGSDLQAFEPSFDVYGFADMGFQRFWGTRVLETSLATSASTFVFGNANFYFDAEPVRDWRFLAEIRFSLLPDGTENIFGDDSGAPPFVPADSSVLDLTSPSLGLNEVKLGSIIVERAHTDYSFADWLQVRAGLFLTPVGIWNVDHGTPTLISTTFPMFQVTSVFPERQLGVELSGSALLGNWELAYHAYVSNGRTVGQVDLTDDKGFGGRLVLRTSRPFRMQFGLSGYVGQFETVQKELISTSEGPLLEPEFPVAYNEQAGGADISLDIGELRIRAEIQARRVIYEDGKRGSIAFEGGSSAADRIEIGGYFLAAYRLPWAGLEPFVFMDALRWPTGAGELLLMPSGGLNVHFNPSVVLKLQYSYLRPIDNENDGEPLPFQQQHLHFALSRLAIAF